MSPADTRALKLEVAGRLAQHRQRRPRTEACAQPVLPMDGMPAPSKRRVADSVAARFAKTSSYRDFLQAEAEAAMHRAEATAEVARRNAEAVAAAQQELLTELDRWNAGPCPVEDAAAISHEPPTSAGQDLPLELSSAATRTIQEKNDTAPAAAGVHTGAAADPPAFMTEPLEPALPLPANLIEFPRHLVAARKARPRLAEGPLREDADAAPERAQLRIFEVEASTLSPVPAASSALPEWHTIRLEAQDAAPKSAVSAAQASLLTPIYAAPVSLRLMASTVDACCISSAFLLAVLVASYASPELPGGLFAAAAAAGTLGLFAVLYFLLFFSFNEATPGMRYARIGLCTFADENPTRGSMRRRLFAVLLAGLPLGLGLVWMCLDEDGLGWHDRISRMYLREY